MSEIREAGVSRDKLKEGRGLIVSSEWIQASGSDAGIYEFLIVCEFRQVLPLVSDPRKRSYKELVSYVRETLWPISQYSSDAY